MKCIRALYIDIKDTNVEQIQRKYISTTVNYGRGHLCSSSVIKMAANSGYYSDVQVGTRISQLKGGVSQYRIALCRKKAGNLPLTTYQSNGMDHKQR